MKKPPLPPHDKDDDNTNLDGGGGVTVGASLNYDDNGSVDDEDSVDNEDDAHDDRGRRAR